MLSQLINTTKHDNIRIDALRLDGGTQPRQGINAAYVTELAESIVEGATLPPVEVIYDGANYWLYDGFHRVAAHQQAGILIVDANIHQGTQADAQWRSYAANQTHGLRRTNEDKERAIKAALCHPNGVTMANREIARHLGVDHKTVGSWREKMESTGEIPQSTTRTGADGRTINTANIGATRPAPIMTSSDAGLFASAESALSVSLLANGQNKIKPPFEYAGKRWVAVSAEFGPNGAKIDCIRVHQPDEPIAPGERNKMYIEGAFTGRAVAGGGRTYTLGAQWLIVTRPAKAELDPQSYTALAAAAEERRRAFNAAITRTQPPAGEDSAPSLESLPVIPDDLAHWHYKWEAGEIYLEDATGRTTESCAVDQLDELFEQARRMDESLPDEDAPNHAAPRPSPLAPDLPISQRDDYDSDEWYTPADYIEAARRVMGSIALDPATSELAQTVVKADAYLTKFDNGLAQPWLGATVWLNPPYSDTQRWVDKLGAEYAKGIFIKQAIILVNNATETTWFQALLAGYPVCLPSRRLAFWRHDHSNVGARQGQAIFYLGPNVETFVSEFAQFGPILRRIDQ